MPVHLPYLPGHSQVMLTEIYIEALLADQVWKAWDSGEIDDLIALRAWWWMVVSGTHKFWCWRTIENQESPHGQS